MNRDRQVADAKKTTPRSQWCAPNTITPAPALKCVFSARNFSLERSSRFTRCCASEFISEHDALGRAPSLGYILAGGSITRAANRCPSSICSSSNARHSSACAVNARPKSA